MDKCGTETRTHTRAVYAYIIGFCVIWLCVLWLAQLFMIARSAALLCRLLLVFCFTVDDGLFLCLKKYIAKLKTVAVFRFVASWQSSSLTLDVVNFSIYSINTPQFDVVQLGRIYSVTVSSTEELYIAHLKLRQNRENTLKRF